ncbi:MFS transporter [Sedimentibacter sp. zth1]|uniref:MFS transporter n=1 Tax=Sedimentibacter sp. zth1 TaxID=2816908 RepID=UPI001A93857B|nr:MFS transporter [Sedimentibacter sp. zth1]QSX05162.1 MFS transporter [Sedimentibacter sp. zth1]
MSNKTNKLWTKNFSIITIGSIISMLGNSVSGFAIGLMVLDYTNSTFLFALFMVIYNLPKVAAPLFAGPYVDRFSRKKVIYTLDFMSAALYIILFFFITSGAFNYIILLFLTLIVGTIDGIYAVAYESLYPNLITEGNYSKAYSISSMIYPLAAFMVPIASIIYNKFGTPAPLFLFNAFTFLIAACFETKIDYCEQHLVTNKIEKFNFKQYKLDFKESLKYIGQEKGLLTITAYFCLTMFASSGSGTLFLPFFKNNPDLFSNIPIDVVTLFSIITCFGVFGRLVGALIHYKFKYPTNKKFAIAISVYTIIAILEATQLYFPIVLMAISFFLVGILGVTSFNIRISATQSYIPDTIRGRFNGVFQMLCTLGSIVGQLLAGALGEFINERIVIIIFMCINMLGVIFIMYRGKEHVKKIYNRNV